MLFRWSDWNLDHASKHDVTPEEAEYVVDHAKAPYPEQAGDEKFRVRGQGRTGAYLQVVFAYDDDEVTAYIIHARRLTPNEVRQYRRRIR